MTARQVGRRDAAAGGLAALIMGISAAGSAKAEELDGELLQSATEFHQLRAEDRAAWSALRSGVDDEDELWDRCNSETGHWTRIDAAAERVRMLAARTPEGLRAKAGVVLALLFENNRPDIEAGREDEDIGAALSLVRDILGGTGQ